MSKIIKTAKPITSADALVMRKKSGLNQSQFWSRLGVTQSGGSRYESGRDIPRPVQTLLVIAYGTEHKRTKLLDELVFTKS